MSLQYGKNLPQVSEVGWHKDNGRGQEQVMVGAHDLAEDEEDSSKIPSEVCDSIESAKFRP